MMKSEEISNGGAWIGIDLGTSNCAAAVWDISRSRCKVLRLGYNNLARPPSSSSSSPSNKGGKIVPSAVLFRRRTSSNSDDDKNFSIGKEISSLVGYAATQMVTDAITDSREGGGALVTSFKRVVGMKSSEANELKSNESDFWNSLPFDCIVTDVNDKFTDKQQHENNRDKSLHDDFFDILGDSSIEDNDITNVDIEEEEGVAIRIQLSSQDEIIVTPLQVTTIILRAIQDAAIEYLTTNNNKSKKIQPPGLLLQQDGNTSQTIPNCVIGVPAHYSHAQRAAIRNAARKAGFSGHVSVMTESTAAALAYGLFVSPMVSRLVSNNNDGATTIATTSTNNSSSGEKNILVFDMGGGTTDVTIATINFGTPSVDDDNVRFHVVATACDSRLGGDDVDELLARYIWKLYAPATSAATSQNDELTWNVNERRKLISECRRAKEELCCSIDDKSSNDGMRINIGTVDASIIFQGKTISISTQEFNSVIQPIVDRAELVIQDALSTFKFRHDQMKMNTPIIHEVVLVGGSTHIPTVRTMLRRIFPPPIPSELCTSISAESAVAQGLAIQAALLSGLVPLWELRNAMMMDVLPHSIGVWISPIINMNSHNDSNDAGGSKAVPVPFTKGQIINPATNQDSHQGYYVPILDKDAPLPAKGNAAFTLADVKQPGVTVIAVEQIGPGDIFQCMGVFDFLLYRLEHNDDSKVRQVKIGMALEESGEFTVSIFDEKDPDHRDKRRRYLIEKALLRDGSSIKNIQKDGDEHLYDEDEERIDQRYSGTEISLAIICVISFVLYVATRIAFSNASSLEVCANPG